MSIVYCLLSSALRADWPTNAFNYERTNWGTENVTGATGVKWIRPMNGWVHPTNQMIAANSHIYAATGHGLNVLVASNGSLAWRYDTQLPVMAPTIVGNYVYVPGMDRKIHKLSDNGASFTSVWTFTGAQAGFYGSPVVTGGYVYATCRDGYVYGINDSNGSQAWRYPPAGQNPLAPIRVAAAYKDGVLYFCADDNYAYAVNSADGTLRWKSARKIRGATVQSFWPVLYQDKVIFTAANSYRDGSHNPGTSNLSPDTGASWEIVMGTNPWRFEYGTAREQGGFPSTTGDGGWMYNYQKMDAARIFEYYEDNTGNPGDGFMHKPWRSFFNIINTADGTEYTMDIDSDGHPEYGVPVTWTGSRSGVSAPPVVGLDGTLYVDLWQDGGTGLNGSAGNTYIMGWRPGSRYLSRAGSLRHSADEPCGFSGSGNWVYECLACVRDSTAKNIATGATFTPWSYNTQNLINRAPAFDDLWSARTGESWLIGYFGAGSANGIYHNHSDQQNFIPYNGCLYIAQCNSLICMGTGGDTGTTPLATLAINQVTDSLVTPTVSELKARLEREVSKMIAAGNLKPGYYNASQWGAMAGTSNIWRNTFCIPAQTLLTLANAYPHMSSAVQTQLQAYLAAQWSEYFYPTSYGTKGWAEGVSRDGFDYPPDVLTSMNSAKSGAAPIYTAYAIWKYAANVPGVNMTNALARAKAAITYPIAGLTNDAYNNNMDLAGYVGVLNLQTLAGDTGTIAGQSRATIQAHLDTMLAARVSGFAQNTTQAAFRAATALARNFLFMTPEVGDYMHDNGLAAMQTAMNDYTYVGQMWFVSRYECGKQEGTLALLESYPALYSAKAYVMQEPYTELTKWLDCPAFPVGDLYYMDNLIAAINAGSAGPYITVTAPAGGESFLAGSAQTVTWISNEVTSNIDIQLSTNGGSTYSNLVTNTTNDGTQSVTLPSVESAVCIIRVKETGAGTISDDSASFTITAGVITVTAPNGGETLTAGTQSTVAWSNSGMVGLVRIELSTNGGTTYTTLVASTANDGSESITVPSYASTQCRIRVAETDGAPSDTSNANFTIQVPVTPQVNVVYPSGGEAFQVSTQITVLWTTSGTVSNVNVDLSTNGGTTYSTLTANTANDGSQLVTLPATASTNCKIRISETDGNPYDETNGVFILQTAPIPPEITVTYPNGAETLTAATVLYITWISAGNVGNVNLDITTNGGATYSTVVSNTANDGTQAITLPSVDSTACRIRVTEPDGSPSDTSDANFTIEQPVMVPVISLNSNTLGFGTISRGGSSLLGFTVSNTGGGTLSGSISSNESWIQISPTTFTGNSTIVNVVVYNTSLADGLHTGVVTVTSNGGTATVTVSVTATGAATIPQLSVSTGTLDFGTLDPKEDKTLTFNITNAGGGTLTGTITKDSDWISLTPTAFSGNNSLINVTVTNDALTDGQYSDTITIDAGSAGTELVEVTLTATCVLPKPNPYDPSLGNLVFFGDGIVPNQTDITIYSLSGSVVAELARQNSDEITWKPEKLASGVYVYTYKSPKEKGVGKVTVINR